MKKAVLRDLLASRENKTTKEEKPAREPKKVVKKAVKRKEEE